MCYSVESSLHTTLLSFAAIVYLMSSQIPHYQWLGVTLIGWCLMQFAELLLWLTKPQETCTDYNKLITLTLIPIILMLQPLGSLIGSLYVIPWSKSSDFRKYFLVLFPIFIVLCVSYCQYYNPYTYCTTVTPKGHLYWFTSDYKQTNTITNILLYVVFSILILLPLTLFWNKSSTIILLLVCIPLIGFWHGLLHTDSRGSIWCYYTSYGSLVMAACLFLQQAGIYNILG